MADSDPSSAVTDLHKTDFENLFDRDVECNEGKLIEYDSPHPKYRFLEYLARFKNACFHGSTDKQLVALEPRRATGTGTGQAETAVYVTTDVFMAIFFAIIDRTRVSYFATRHDPNAYFVDRKGLGQNPWVEGIVYICSLDAFESKGGAYPVSYDAVSPMARLWVLPQDFPLFDRVHPIDKIAEADSKFDLIKAQMCTSSLRRIRTQVTA